MRIVLRPHLMLRLKEREIPQNYPEEILLKPEIKYFDTLTNHSIAVKKLEYNGKLRSMAVAYDIIGTEIQVITVYPTTNQEIKNRVQNRRWIKYENS